jgi:hypothetical protein
MELVYAVILGVILHKYIIPILDLKFENYSNNYNIKTLEQNCQANNIQNKQKIKNISNHEEMLAIELDVAQLEKEIEKIRGLEPKCDEGGVCGFRYESPDEYPENWEDDDWDDWEEYKK